MLLFAIKAYAIVAIVSFVILWGINGFCLPTNGDRIEALLFCVGISALWPVTMLSMVALMMQSRSSSEPHEEAEEWND